MMTRLNITALLLLVASAVQAEDSPQPAENFEILFMGNSHSSSNGLPNILTTLIKTGLPGATATARAAPGFSFLAERLTDGVSQPLLVSRPWTHVILQAQKYSSSGLYYYPTDAAEEWIRRAKAQNALPIMFPEWPRRGNLEEGPRVHQLHLDIASREAACVAPIAAAWEESRVRDPFLVLHARDGNHANLAGSLLTAFVFYEFITGRVAAKLPHISSISVSAGDQQKLRDIASFVLKQNGTVCAAKRLATGGDRIQFDWTGDAAQQNGVATLTNTGIFALTLSSISEPEAPFHIRGGTCATSPITLASQESCSLSIDFAPEGGTHYSGYLKIEVRELQQPVLIRLAGSMGTPIPASSTWSRSAQILALAIVSAFALYTGKFQRNAGNQITRY